MTGEELFNELHADVLSDCPNDFETRCSDVEIDSLSKNSYEFGHCTSKTANLQTCCDCYTVHHAEKNY